MYGLGECIVEKIHRVVGYWCDTQEVVDTLFSNDTVKENVTSELLAELTKDNRTLMSREKQWLEVLDRYSVEKCPGKVLLPYHIHLAMKQCLSLSLSLCLSLSVSLSLSLSISISLSLSLSNDPKYLNQSYEIV